MTALRVRFGVCCLSACLAVPCMAVIEWPLQTPAEIQVQQMSDFRGALYRLGYEAIQIDQIAWMVTPSGNLTVRMLSGYRADGGEYLIKFALGPNRAVNTLEDFHDFRLARGSDDLIVSSIDWAICAPTS